MANTYTQLLIHMVFSTKNRLPLIRKEDLALLHKYIGGILNDIGCQSLIVGGIENHVHILFDMHKCKDVSSIAKVVKASSSKWIKTNHESYECFAWQDGYAAFAVSHLLKEKVINYIENQEQHHKYKSFEDEYRMTLVVNEIDFNDDYLF